MASHRGRLLAGGALAGLAVGVLGASLWLGGALDRWEAVSWDARVRLLARPSAAVDSVAVILLDQASLDWGADASGWSWPWPREVYGAVVAFCRRGGARGVALDVLFTEPSIYGVWDDEALGAALAERPDCVAAVHVRTAGSTLPVAEVAAGAALLGNVSDAPDPDGVFRRVRLAVSGADGPVPSLGLGMFLLAHGGPAAPWRLAGGELTAAGVDVPLDADGRALLRFSPAGAIPAYSAAAVIQSELRLREGGEPVLDPGVLAGRYVLFGFSAPGLLDQRPTPVEHVSPGVLLHATAVENLLARDFMRPAPRLLAAFAVVLLGALGGLTMAGSRRAWHSLTVTAVLLALPAALGVLAYHAGWWWPLVPGELTAAGGLVAGLAVNYSTEGRQRRFLKQAFRHYLSPEVVEKLVEDPGRLRLGGERRELSILFSDLAGFTGIGERLDPERLTSLLNEYLTAMTDIILAAGGTLDKYEGDAIIAFWNAPLDVADHAAQACRAAVLCQRELARRRPEWERRFGCTLRMRVGLHTGPVVVGNLGSEQRFNYTILGDAANLASRLEGANKVFGSETMISAATRTRAGRAVQVRELGAVVVVGRQEPVTVFELGGLAGDPQPQAWATYRQALALAREGRGAEALALLRVARADLVAVAAAAAEATATDSAPAAVVTDVAAAGDRPSAALMAALEADPDFRGTWRLTSK